MNPTLAQRSLRPVPALLIGLVAVLLGAAAECSLAQVGPWGYIPDPESSAPPPSIGLVPGRGLVRQASEGWTVNTGAGLSYDDNQFQTAVDEFAGAIFTSDLSLQYVRGDRKQRGVFFGGNLDIAYFDYLDEPIIGERSGSQDSTLANELSPAEQQILSEADGRSLRDGQDPFEFGWGGFIGVKGANTTVTLSGTYAKDNGNSTDQQRRDRESLRRSSDNYFLGLNASHRLGRGSLNAGLSVSSTEYAGQLEDSVGVLMGEPQVPVGGLNDQTSWAANVGWTHQPQATPKTSFNVGVGFGGSEQDGGTKQKNINPNVGVNYRYSPKTSFFGNVGVSFTESESTTTRLVPVDPPPVAPAPVVAPGAPAPEPVPVVIPPPMVVIEENSYDRATPTFGLGASWSPNETTHFGVIFSQSTNPSSIQGQSSYDSRSITFTGTKQFPRGYYASLDYSLENTSYTNNAGVEDSSPGRGTPDDYSRFGLSFGRQVQLRPAVSLNMSAFYQRNVGSGEDVLSEFEQNIAGIRVGLSF